MQQVQLFIRYKLTNFIGDIRLLYNCFSLHTASMLHAEILIVDTSVFFLYFSLKRVDYVKCKGPLFFRFITEARNVFTDFSSIDINHIFL